MKSLIKRISSGFNFSALSTKKYLRDQITDYEDFKNIFTGIEIAPGYTEKSSSFSSAQVRLDEPPKLDSQYRELRMSFDIFDADRSKIFIDSVITESQTHQLANDVKNSKKQGPQSELVISVRKWFTEKDFESGKIEGDITRYVLDGVAQDISAPVDLSPLRRYADSIEKKDVPAVDSEKMTDVVDTSRAFRRLQRQAL